MRFQKGSLLASVGDMLAAVPEFEKALCRLESDHPGDLSRLAYINDLSQATTT